jgi:hypothetical protein
MTEVRPGVWKLRVYAGRRANGTPVQIQKTVEAKEARAGAGKRLAERELAAMVADVSKGAARTGTETSGELLDAWLAHIEPHPVPHHHAQVPGHRRAGGPTRLVGLDLGPDPERGWVGQGSLCYRSGPAQSCCTTTLCPMT